MKIIVAVVVYNRIDNIKRWVKCWEQSNTGNSELFVIHNGTQSNELRTLLFTKNLNYITRKNIGFDIGAFQDVCKERLHPFPNDWDYLIWCTDDTVPMDKNFIHKYIDAFKLGVGVTCMQISKSVNPHVRTTGFCISKELSKKIQFLADPITTKSQCYVFEHQGKEKTFTNQVRRMGLSCVALAPNEISPMWDMGYHKRLDRMEEHEEVFNYERKTNKVTFICTIFNSYPQIISSLIMQTYKNWELVLIHDGPSENGMRSYIGNDPRVNYIETETRIGNWGHGLRKWALDEIKEGRLSDPDYIVITNADNYYVPSFIKSMLKGFEKENTIACYCEKMVHSYINWGIIDVRLERGFVDCGGVMVKKLAACEIGWKDTESHSSDWTYFSDIIRKYSSSNFNKVPGCLLIHN